MGVHKQSLDFSWGDVYIHEYFDPNGNNNDIALIKLKTPIKFSKQIQPIQLPYSTSAYNKTNGKIFEEDKQKETNYYLIFILLKESLLGGHVQNRPSARLFPG